MQRNLPPLFSTLLMSLSATRVRVTLRSPNAIVSASTELWERREKKSQHDKIGHDTTRVSKIVVPRSSLTLLTINATRDGGDHWIEHGLKKNIASGRAQKYLSGNGRVSASPLTHSS